MCFFHTFVSQNKYQYVKTSFIYHFNSMHDGS